ncbi:hypothetical protein [Paenibacillus sp. PL91]|uniref:hypothetical protein n=1 Tax=Paenibacillus sp. PL91 TaxID=2729538 RepID=UPI00145DC4CC|nr:hypothetical protein [Paenibacillus sp. PL91]MBC9204914.1 hypothetical protein [Paenibacillus sp. PL91]
MILNVWMLRLGYRNPAIRDFASTFVGEAAVCMMTGNAIDRGGNFDFFYTKIGLSPT